MSSSTSSFKRLLIKTGIIATVILALLWSNSYALRHGPTPNRDMYAYAPTFSHQEEIDIIFMGNSVMYHNLDDDNTLINAKLSERLGRKINVKFVSAGGVDAAWAYTMLKEFVIPYSTEKPVVWFFWTGMPFDSQEKLVHTDKNEDYFRLGTFFRKHTYFFRIATDTRNDAHEFLQRFAFDLFSPHIETNHNNMEEVLSELFRESDPTRKFEDTMGSIKKPFQQTVKEANHNFERNVPESLMVKFMQLIRENGIEMSFVEVTSRALLQRDPASVPQFVPKDFDFQTFFAYREKQNRFIKGHGYDLISFVEDDRFQAEMFAGSVYLEEEFRELFAEIVAEEIIKKGILVPEDRSNG